MLARHVCLQHTSACAILVQQTYVQHVDHAYDRKEGMTRIYLSIGCMIFFRVSHLQSSDGHASDGTACDYRLFNIVPSLNTIGLEVAQHFLP